MKSFISKHALLAMLTMLPTCAWPQNSTPTRYEQHVSHYRQGWAALIPTQAVVQYAGNMGMVSAGVGWSYGRHQQFETQLLAGYLPHFETVDDNMTLTLKENIMPWRVALKHGWSVEPLECGVYFNVIFGEDFWDRLPRSYPKGYYWISTKVRTNVFVGQRVTKRIPRSHRRFVKSVTTFYEVSTCDIYLINYAEDHGWLSPWDLLCLSAGVKVQFL